MTSPLKIAARIEIEGTQAAAAGASAVRGALTDLGTGAKHTTVELQKLIATSTGLHSGAMNDNARRWSGVLADEAMSIDRLRAKYNPLFAVISQYKQAQVEIRTAHAMGALSADEMTAALSRQRQATLASIDAIKGRSRAIAETPAMTGSAGGNHAYQTANLAFQAQDIAVTAAMGMNPLMIGLQQGMQMAPVIASMERPVAGLAAAFASLVSPVSLVTVGLTAGTAALIQYFTTADEGAGKTNALLDQQNDIIRRAAAFWGEATPALKGYVDQLERAQQASDAREAGGLIASRELEEMGVKLEALRDKAVSAFSVLRAQPGTDETIRTLGYAWDELREKVAAGTATVADFDNAKNVLANAVRTNGSPAMIEFSTSVDAVTAAFYRSLAAAQSARSSWFAAVAGGDNVQDILSKSTFVDNGGVFQTDQFIPRGAPVPGKRPLIELEGLPGGDKLARGAASARNAYRDLIKSADDRIAQMKLEAEMADKVGLEAEALRFELDLLQRSEDKGRSITEAQRAAITARVDAFKEYAEAAATAKLKADLLWESEQAGRTWMDQQVAGRLRSSGLPVDFDSYEAGLIRTNLALQSARDYAGDFAHTLFDGLDQGKGLWNSFADAGIDALKRLGRSLLDDVLNNIFSIKDAASGLGGGGGGGGIFGSIFGSLFSPQWRLASSGAVGLFSSGGYTGPGGIHEARGVVHAGEVVWSQADVARVGGPATAEAMRLGLAGYARGGVVGVQPMLPDGREMRNGELVGGIAASPDRAPQPVQISVDVTGARGNQEIQEMVRDGVSAGLQEYDMSLAEKVLDINANPRWRGGWS